MKLKDLFENSEEDKDKLKKLFSDADENKKLNTFVKKQVYQVKIAEKGEQVHINFPGEISKNTTVEDEKSYIVRFSDNVNKITVIDEDELLEKYELMNSNAKPDAEGYQDYIEKGNITAFLYDQNDTLNLSISGHRLKIQINDYIGYHSDDPETLIIMPKTKFEQEYKLA